MLKTLAMYLVICMTWRTDLTVETDLTNSLITFGHFGQLSREKLLLNCSKNV